MADERDRLRRQLGLSPTPAPTPVTAPSRLATQESGAIGAASIASRMQPTAAPTSDADERTRIQAIGPVTTLKPTGAQRAAGTKAQREQRFAEELAAREASKPTEDPGEGNIWSYSVAEGRWKRVKVSGGFGGTAGGTTGGGTTGGGTTGGGTTGAGAGDGTTTTYTAPDGKIFTDLNSYNAYLAQLKAEEKRMAGQSAYDLLFEQFNEFGLGGLVEPLKGFITEGLSKAEFTLRLRDTDAYKKRFAANAQRIQKGLRALSEAEYINLEDQYQDVMRRYGLPESYYTRGDMGRQEGFEKFIGGDVSPVELEDRIQTAQNRVINANPEVSKALREFYPDITNGDILAYALDPKQAITNIKRKVGAAEIGAGAMQAGLTTGLARAEELQRYGVTKETAQQGFGTIASGLERGRQLSQIYNQPDYTQAVAETEVFALPDAEKARRQRRRLTQLETTTFSGTSGVTGGALDRERAGQY